MGDFDRLMESVREKVKLNRGKKGERSVMRWIGTISAGDDQDTLANEALATIRSLPDATPEEIETIDFWRSAFARQMSNDQVTSLELFASENFPPGGTHSKRATIYNEGMLQWVLALEAIATDESRSFSLPEAEAVMCYWGIEKGNGIVWQALMKYKYPQHREDCLIDPTKGLVKGQPQKGDEFF